MGIKIAGASAFALIWALASSTGARAQEAVQDAGQGVGEIIVTAQKRETNMQKTPLAISALNGDDLANRQINTMEALAGSLPNVNLGKNVGFARVSIRGLGLDTTATGQEGRVAYHVDGVYISRPTATLGTFFDVSRIEVVRGPQGILYGRNATAGAINVITNQPTDVLSGYARVTAGNYDAFTEEAAVGGPVSSTLGARFAIQKVDRGGYGENLTTGTENDNEHTLSSRATMRWEPSPTFDLTVTGDYRMEDDHNYLYHYLGEGKPGLATLAVRLGGVLPANPRDSYEESPTINNRRFYGFAATANLDLGFAKLTSVTGYRHSKTFWNSDVDSTAITIARFNLSERASQFSEEARLAGDFSNGDWLIGGYYFHEKIDGFTNFSPITRAVVGGPQTLGQGFYFGGELTTDAYAAFGQIRYELAPGFSVSAGLRYSYEKKAVDEGSTGLNLAQNYDPTVAPVLTRTQQDSITFDSLTPRFGVEYQASNAILLYATYAQGFKSGGYNLGSLAPPFLPEKLTDYEAGVKATWFDGHLRTNLSAFYYDYKNLQVQKVVGTVLQVLNAASATVKGMEAEIVAKPVDGLQLESNISLLDSKYKNFSTLDPARTELGVLDLTGNRLSQAPKYAVNLAGQYTLVTGVGDFTLRGEGNWVGKVYFSPFNQDITSQAAHSKFNAFLTYETKGGLSVQAFIRNIANKRFVSSAQVSSGLWGFPVVGSFEPPRTYGVTLGYKF